MLLFLLDLVVPGVNMGSGGGMNRIAKGRQEGIFFFLSFFEVLRR